MTRIGFYFFLFVFVASHAFNDPGIAHADTTSNIQAQITANNQQIDALKAEITEFQRQLDILASKKNTLQSTIDSIAISQKQLASQIKVTQNKIASANLQIRELTNSIGDKEELMATDRVAIGKALRTIAENENISLVTTLISSNSFGVAWKAVDESAQFNRALAQDIARLRVARSELATNRDAVTAEKLKLVLLKDDLALKKRSVDASKVAQTQLLAQTKNQEANYQNLIAQKQAAEKTFEQELLNLQQQLTLVVHTNLLPKVGTGVLSWPFSQTFMLGCSRLKKSLGNPYCVTQYYGNTSFATANPQVYKGKGHNAIDIGAPIGTPVQAALSGIVLDTGNTDLVRGCYSFGKWIMVVHGNGLSTIYSHLSNIDVVKGQSVTTGEVIGLSGMTGYATGPHIHFGVYATEGTQIMTLRQFKGATIGCADAKMPVATLTAYLNPLSYL